MDEIKEIKQNRLSNILKSNISLLERSTDNDNFIGFWIGMEQYAFYTSYNMILKFYFSEFIAYCGIQDNKDTQDLLLVLLYQNISINNKGFTILWS